MLTTTSPSSKNLCDWPDIPLQNQRSSSDLEMVYPPNFLPPSSPRIHPLLGKNGLMQSFVVNNNTCSYKNDCRVTKDNLILEQILLVPNSNGNKRLQRKIRTPWTPLQDEFALVKSLLTTKYV